MNKKSVQSLSARYMAKKVKTQQQYPTPYSRDKCMEKGLILTQYHQKGSKFQLNHKSSQNLNDDYFYSHNDQKESLRFRDSRFKGTGENTSRQLSKSFSEQEKSQAQIEELRIIRCLNAKIIELESSFAQSQNHYNQKINELKNQLKSKIQQTEQLSEVLQELSIQQKSAVHQVEILMRMLTGSSLNIPITLIPNKQNQSKPSPLSIGVLPLMSKGQQKFLQKTKPKTNRMKVSQIMFRKGEQRTGGKTSRVLKTEDMSSRGRNPPMLTGTGLVRNFQSYRMAKG